VVLVVAVEVDSVHGVVEEAVPEEAAEDSEAEVVPEAGVVEEAVSEVEGKLL
jgi:hypothetical protein